MKNNNETFEEFLIRKNNINNNTIEEAIKRKMRYVNSVYHLYDIIKANLKCFEEKKLLSFKEAKIKLDDQHLGQYTIKKLEIRFGVEKISLIPINTYITGYVGRVDIRGKNSECMILEDDWNNWKFAKTIMDLQTWDITETSLFDIIKKLTV